MSEECDNIPKRVLFVAFPKSKMLDLVGPLQVFTDASVNGKPCYVVTVSSPDGGVIRTDTVLPVSTVSLRNGPDTLYDTVIIVGGAGAFTAAKDPDAIALVKEVVHRSRRVGAVCTGAFVLAAAGILENRRVVTHWSECSELASTYPSLQVEVDPIYVRDGHIWTSAGVTAGIDMALAMVSEDYGKTVALDLARSLVSYLTRPGGQSQFSHLAHSRFREASDRFNALHAWMQENLQSDLRIEALAAAANMSPRNFSRVYALETGLSPAKAVEELRLQEARKLLETSRMPIKAVAVKSGFGDEERLRRVMLRHLRISPSDYRDRFKTI
ncbi:hypothetical protein AB838_06245 [Rhodobacteraceae bacterium (ex Bugula neritina AB1)]|nr:hypothetical protein AB838_06245 [Rhodobacteraceae bacterium (ex Bugula neritina AB1)]